MVVRRLAEACGEALLDVHSDSDHNRSVFTLVAPDERRTTIAAVALARAVAELVSLEGHAGVHPRLGALDVVPFVALAESAREREKARAAAQAFGAWWAEEFRVPVFLYDDADPAHRSLPEVRRAAFSERPPDVGPDTPHPRLGATAVGARRPLVAINCVLATSDLTVARHIARGTRERDGGLCGVRALGFAIADGRRTQVSMNLVDLDQTGVEAACTHVRALARAAGSEVAAVELVGLMPEAELARSSAAFRSWSGLDAEMTIEARAARAWTG